MEQLLDAQRELLGVVRLCVGAPPVGRPTFGAVGRRLRSIQKQAGRNGLAEVTPRRSVGKSHCLYRLCNHPPCMLSWIAGRPSYISPLASNHKHLNPPHACLPCTSVPGAAMPAC
jgi:hypothetical protein